jgi:hypothetical protein
MDADSAIIEAAFTLGKYAGTANLTPDGARMFARLLDLTVRPGIATIRRPGTRPRAVARSSSGRSSSWPPRRRGRPSPAAI